MIKGGILTILHISTQAAWQAALTAGSYQAASLYAEGFIHCSTAAQVEGVANAFYAGQPDLVLLVIDETRVSAELRWEAPAHPAGAQAAPPDDAQRFPHIYGPINLDAVQDVVALPPGPDGTFSLPEGL